VSLFSWCLGYQPVIRVTVIHQPLRHFGDIFVGDDAIARGWRGNDVAAVTTDINAVEAYVGAAFDFAPRCLNKK